MKQDSNSRGASSRGGRGREIGGRPDEGRNLPGGERALSTRSIIASTLLGAQPPELPARVLVRAAELFGVAEGTTRVALSRMVAAGDLAAESGAYRLVRPTLLERQARQTASRRAEQRRWSGRWHVAVVTAGRRDAATRATLRDATNRLRLAELREGVWVRPDNLDPERLPAARAVVERQCCSFRGDRDLVEGEADDAALAASLWDLPAWAAGAGRLREELRDRHAGLVAGDTDVLAPAFVLSAAVLRHLLADPLLPDALVPRGWPGVPLRADYDRFDSVFLRAWRDWVAAQE